jgi:hypothetical protein
MKSILVSLFALSFAVCSAFAGGHSGGSRGGHGSTHGRYFAPVRVVVIAPRPVVIFEAAPPFCGGMVGGVVSCPGEFYPEGCYTEPCYPWDARIVLGGRERRFNSGSRLVRGAHGEWVSQPVRRHR